jgi:hypothetical protein
VHNIFVNVPWVSSADHVSQQGDDYWISSMSASNLGRSALSTSACSPKMVSDLFLHHGFNEVKFNGSATHGDALVIG